MEFIGDFKKEWECLNALRETGGSVGNIGSTKSEVRRWIQDLDYK